MSKAKRKRLNSIPSILEYSTGNPGGKSVYEPEPIPNPPLDSSGPITFGRSCRGFTDTTAVVYYISSAYEYAISKGMRPNVINEGSFGRVEKAPAFPLSELLVMKSFKKDTGTRENYAPHVLETLHNASLNADDTLTPLVVWSYDYLDGENNEHVIMDQLTPWKKVLLEHAEADYTQLLVDLKAWLKHCFTTLEKHNLSAPDMKSGNLGCLRDPSDGKITEFRIIDTDGLLSVNDDLGMPRFTSTYVRMYRAFHNDSDVSKIFKEQNMTIWHVFLHAVHNYLSDLMCIESEHYLSNLKNPWERICNAQLSVVASILENFNIEALNSQGVRFSLLMPSVFRTNWTSYPDKINPLIKNKQDTAKLNNNRLLRSFVMGATDESLEIQFQPPRAA